MNMADLCVTNKDLKISHKQLVLVNGAPILRSPSLLWVITRIFIARISGTNYTN